MSNPSQDVALPASLPWHRNPLLVAIAGSLLLFAAQPPLGWSLLAWAAPLPWLYLATRATLPGRRPYLQIWLAGFVYWLLALNWIRLAHPATILGLLFLASYMAIYLVLFVKVVREGVTKLALPVWVVAPAAWVATEWLQGNLLSGFLMASLGHTQINEPMLLQIADLGGAYLVSALVMLLPSCAWECRLAEFQRNKLSAWRAGMAMVVAATALVGARWYGQEKINTYRPATDSPTHHVALIQGSHRAVWASDPNRDERVMDTYIDLSREAKRTATVNGSPLDLIVWPEGMFRTLLYTYDPDAETPDIREYAAVAPADLAAMVTDLSAPVLVGIDRYHALAGNDQGRVYNAAIAVAGDGTVIGTYEKTHLVMFGEYVPGGSLWPGIYRYFPIGGVTPGIAPRAFDIDGIRYMPTICFETFLPHVVRRQVAQLANAGERPEVLVNLTNDSWFYDSSELDMHLTSSRLRAIECRTPMVVAANGGLSANIDCCGRVLDVSEPMAEEVLLAKVSPGGHASLYLQYGDAFAIACVAVSLLVVAAGMLRPSVPETTASH